MGGREGGGDHVVRRRVKRTAMRVAVEKQKDVTSDSGAVRTQAVYRSGVVEGREHAGAYVGGVRYIKQETSSRSGGIECREHAGAYGGGGKT